MAAWWSASTGPARLDYLGECIVKLGEPSELDHQVKLRQTGRPAPELTPHQTISGDEFLGLEVFAVYRRLIVEVGIADAALERTPDMEDVDA